MKPPVKLTRDKVEAMKPASARREVRDALAPGLRLVVQPSGHRSWAFRYKLGGVARKLTLGDYPALNLDTARTAAATARGNVQQGRDPAAERAIARAPANSVLAAFKDYDRGHLSWGRDYTDHESGEVAPAAKDKHGNIVEPAIGANTAKATRSFFLRRVLPVWGLRQVGSITRQDAVTLLDTLKAFKDARRKGRTRLSHFFGWTMDRNSLVTGNPAAGIAAEGSKSRERSLTDDELRRVWLACDDVGTFGALVRTLLLTLARRTEAARMERAELKPALWSLEGHRTKNGRSMDIARTSQLNTVLEPLLAKSNSPFVFEGRHHDRPIGGFSDWKDKLDAAIGKDVAPWSLHDLRRTGVSLMQRLGIAFEIREACQNHKIKGIAGTYSRHDYDDEKRHAFEDLAAEIERIVADRKDRNGATVGG
jgi:hypothetical protein